LKNYKNSAYENVLTTSDLSTYVTSSSLTSTLLNYITSSSLTSTLLDYVTNSSLTSTLTSYVTNSSLTSTLAGYASKSLANTYTALQTFTSGITSNGLITANAGLKVSAGQTLDISGVNILSSAGQMFGPPLVYSFTATAIGQNFTLPAQTAMYVFVYVDLKTFSGTSFTYTPPVDTIGCKGQKIILCNVANYGYSLVRATPTVKIIGSGGTYNAGTVAGMTISAYNQVTLIWMGDSWFYNVG
jgi:hypothetical protein